MAVLAITSSDGSYLPCERRQRGSDGAGVHSPPPRARTLALVDAMMVHRELSLHTRPTLATDSVCCSIACTTRMGGAVVKATGSPHSRRYRPYLVDGGTVVLPNGVELVDAAQSPVRQHQRTRLERPLPVRVRWRMASPGWTSTPPPYPFAIPPAALTRSHGRPCRSTPRRLCPRP